MSQRVITGLLGFVLACLNCMGQDVTGQQFHILLRPKDGKRWFHLGEPITMEVACFAEDRERYLLPCGVVLKAEPASTGSRISADRIDSMVWLDAQSGNLPPGARGVCGTISNQLPSQLSQAPTWSEATLEEPFPTSVGQYKITAIFGFDLEVQDRFGTSENHSSSDEIEISVDDDLGWKDRLIHFRNCDYDDVLTRIPDKDAITALRHHLDDCAVEEDRSFATLLYEIVWLKMQVEQPNLYRRMLELEQNQSSKAGEGARIRQWFHDQYRELLLETARQLATAYKSHPELHSDEDFRDSLYSGFGHWHDVAASLLGGADSYLSREEAAGYLKQAGFSQKYIDRFLKEHKSDLPGDFPTYRR